MNLKPHLFNSEIYQSLHHYEKLIFLHITIMANDRYITWPTAETICGYIGITQHTFYKYLKKLKDKEIIKIKNRYDDGKQKSNLYIINFKAFQKAKEVTDEAVGTSI